MDERFVATNVTAMPVQPQGEPTLQQTLEQTAQAVQQAMDSFPEEEVTAEEEKKARGFLNDFMSYIKGNEFHEDVMRTSRKYKIPPKKVAHGFFQTCLGTIGDILGVAIGTAGNACHTLIDIIANLTHGAVNLVVKVASGLASIVTFNKTCIA